MKILTDITPTANTGCMFRIGSVHCEAAGSITFCVPRTDDMECPYCISMSDYLHEEAQKLKKSKEDIDDPN